MFDTPWAGWVVLAGLNNGGEAILTAELDLGGGATGWVV